MKKFLAGFLAMMMFSNVALAECDFSTGITKNENGTFTYSRECHLKVGEIRQDLSIAQGQNLKLIQALDLKDLALSKADQRADMWMNTSLKLEEKVNTIDQMRSTNQWLYFGLGVLTVFAAGYVVNHTISR